ncbi:hypothetical protein ACO0LM_23130 [Undibacterium sp. Di26W]|uniref:hypothetical protein n=1 Tax=Undibacterium sp. Di26W TaxID=3413035 RepID=UPI003BF0673C
MGNPFRLGQQEKYCLSCVLTAFMVSITVPALSAEPPETNTTLPVSEDTAALTLQHEITTAVDDNAVSVEVTSSPRQLSIDLINSKHSNATPAIRKKEAIRLASILENLIAGKKSYSDVTALHVNYSRVNEGRNRPVQKFNFIRSQSGGFVLKRN